MVYISFGIRIPEFLNCKNRHTDKYKKRKTRKITRKTSWRPLCGSFRYPGKLFEKYITGW